MASIEDFCQDLHKGKKEVSVPKDKVTELSPGWYVSKYNLPHQGSKGSLRNGRLHAHDMGDHYSVHMDRVDPKEHGVGHLVEDAPMMLFLWTGFRDAPKIVKKEYSEQAKGPKGWSHQVLMGMVLLIFGLIIASNTFFALGLLLFATIAALVIIGGMFIWKGLGYRRGRKLWTNVLIGAAAITFSVVIFSYPTTAFKWLLLFLAIWLLASGIFLIFGRGDKLLFDSGSIAPMIMGIISLVLALIIIFNPKAGGELVITIAGLLVAFIGLMQLVSGILIWRSRRRYTGHSSARS
jgi:uncharacterized membrane protein HdeD (DUF308 family)